MYRNETFDQRVAKMREWLSVYEGKERLTTEFILRECFKTEPDTGKKVVIGKIMRKMAYIRVKPPWPSLPYYVNQSEW